MAIGNFFSKRRDSSGQSAADAARQVIGKSDPRRLALLDDFENSDLGWFWATDAESRLIYLSENAAAQFGSGADELIGKPLSELFILEREEGETEDGAAQRPLPFLLRARNTITDLAVRIAIGDKKVWWSISGKPQFDEQGELLGYRGSAKDITSTRENQLEVGRLAQYDSLTGLANRHRMAKRLNSTLTAYKAAKRSCALMMLDLDRFKQVNDTLGHPAGDELLKQVSQRLQRIVGSIGEIGRLGGDEFQIILPDIEDRGRLGDLAARVIQMVSQPYSIDGSRAIIGTSVGVAIAPFDGIESDELVSAADLALYAAKGGGRGQYRFYSSELKDGARLRRQIEEDLRDALVTDQLELHYQPLVDAKTSKVKSFESLLRWNHPERGWISPAEFIPVAEETNQISSLGEWVLRRACKEAASWPVELGVSVNVSAVQFGSADLPQVVKNALQASGLRPSRLELELTESVFIGDPRATQEMFEELKKLGIRLALDDFGTGYSSLGYLKTAPFDKIKIDQSFVRGATEEGNNNSAIITAIVSLARALGMVTVAEGVEAMDELAHVRDQGADLIQGWVFSKALPQDEVVARLESGQLEYEALGPAKHRAERMAVFRRIGVIHEDHRYEAVMRNLSKTGARIEGILDVPLGTGLVLDLGGGQLAVGHVRRSEGAEQGIEFETPLVSDGADGLCTRHRVSPYMLAAAGMPLAALPPGHYPLGELNDGKKSKPRFLQIDLTSDAARQGA